MRFAITLLAAIALSKHAEGQVQPFPGLSPGVDVGGLLPTDFEPSGGAWHVRLDQLLLCSDGSRLARMNRDGTGVLSLAASGNWEGIAVAEPNSDQAFLVNENTAQVREINIISGALGRVFSLTQATPGLGVTPLTAADLAALLDDGDGRGTEALTFVPESGAPEGGEFWAGSQENGTVYRFRLSLSTGNSVTYLGKFKNWSFNDLQGLEYDWHGSQLVLAVFGGSNRILGMSRAGALLFQWQAPVPNGDGEEGLAYDGRYLFVAHDPQATHSVWRYDQVSLQLLWRHGFED